MTFRLRSALLLALLPVALLPSVARAQEVAAAAAVGPPLAPFAAQRVAVVPVQFFRADTSGWSKGVDWASLRLAFDSTVAALLTESGLGKRWVYAPDVVRSAKRNPTYATDPYALGAGRWRTMVPKPGDQMPMVVADNIRPLTALGDTRFALVPLELRGDGADAVLRLVIVDTRGRTVIWTADMRLKAAAELKAVTDQLAAGVAALVIEP